LKIIALPVRYLITVDAYAVAEDEIHPVAMLMRRQTVHRRPVDRRTGQFFDRSEIHPPRAPRLNPALGQATD